jgi:hypothetical protein
MALLMSKIAKMPVKRVLCASAHGITVTINTQAIKPISLCIRLPRTGKNLESAKRFKMLSLHGCKT